MKSIDSEHNNDVEKIKQISIYNINVVQERDKKLNGTKLHHNEQNKNGQTLLEDEKMQAKHTFDSEINLLDKEYAKLKSKLNNIAQHRIENNGKAMIEYKQ
eukprot:212914_1